MHIASKMSTLFLLATLVITPLAACEKSNVLDTTKETASQSRPDDGRIRDNTDVGSNDSAAMNVASAVEGFYRSIGTPEIRSVILTNKDQDFDKLATAYKGAMAYTHQGTSSDTGVYTVFRSLSNNMEILSTKDAYTITVNPSKVTVKGKTATVDTIGSTEIINGKPTLVTEGRATIIQMIEKDGEWFVDVPATMQQGVKQ